MELLAFDTVAYPPELRSQVLGGASADALTIARLDRDLGERFAEAAIEVARRGGVRIADVDYVGSHGQTICHIPPQPGMHGVTLQLGRSAIIAERTGVPVVSDFRARDMALGGQGAPLVPRVDHLLFARPGLSRVLVNIGGIANLTAVSESLEQLVAFDIGPGNALLDALVRIATQGAEMFDEGARRALRGSVHRDLLDRLLGHPFLAGPPPKSVDRDVFGEPLARQILRQHPTVALEDLLATAAVFTATAIAIAVRGLPPPHREVERVIVSGGGVHNVLIMGELSNQLAPMLVDTSDQHGVPVDGKEAIAFAVLAHETMCGRPSNVPGVTGASRAAVLGSITP